MEYLKTGARALATNLVWIQGQNLTESATVCFNAIMVRSTLRVTRGPDIHVMGWDARREGRVFPEYRTQRRQWQSMLVSDAGASYTIRYSKGPDATSSVSPSVRSEIGQGPSTLWSQGLCCVTKPSIRQRFDAGELYLGNNNKDILPTWTPRGHKWTAWMDKGFSALFNTDGPLESCWFGYG